MAFSIQHIKKNKSRRKWWQKWKSVAQTNEQVFYAKNMENLRNRINVKHVSHKKDCLK